MRRYPSVSIITPVYNGGDGFIDCLYAINRYIPASWELIVVNDGSTDRSRSIAEAAGATVYDTAGRMGPGAARNIGSQHAKGEYLFFIDADCEVNEFTFDNLAEEIEENPDVDAFFGSYDDSPRAQNFVAQYKNLVHRYVHQVSNENASTFWAGCGIVRRTKYYELGGFDVNRFRKPSIEDIDLGYRIRHSGSRIKIAKSVQVKHFKAWSLTNLVKVDIFDRGIPWTRLLLANSWCRVNELNLQFTERLLVVCSFLFLGCLAASVFNSAFLLGALATGIVFCGFNHEIFRYFYEYRGLKFTLGVVPMQLLYYFYCGVAFSLGVFFHFSDRFFGRDPFLLSPIAPLRANVRELTLAGRE